MNLRDQITPEILPILDAAIDQGFRVFVLRPEGRPQRLIGFAHVCLDVDGSFGIVSGSHNSFEEPTLGAPIKPDRTFGSSVRVDYSGYEADAIRALREVYESPTIPVRFVGLPAPRVKNYGFKALSCWPGGGAKCFVEYTAALTTSSTSDQEKELSHV